MSESPQRYLIAGLGNPGKRYERTRHNMGYEVVQAFAKKHGWEFKKDTKLQGHIAKGSYKERDVLLLMPIDYINNSGRAIRLTLDYYKIPLDQLLVIVDDVAIEYESLRLKEFGSSGGHNGLKDIQAHLGTSQYPRLRVGIGNPGYKDLDEHVLTRLTSEEMKSLPALTEKAVETAEIWIEQGIKIAMNFANQRPNETPEKGELGDRKDETNQDTSL